MRMPKGLKPGDLLEIRFLDHVEDGEDVIEFLVWGRVCKITRQAIQVESWAFVDPTEAKLWPEGNTKTFTIVKSAIQSLSLLKPSKR